MDEVLQRYGVQSYRQAEVLAVGSGPLLVSLAESLFQSGLLKLHVLITDAAPTDRQRLAHVVEAARRTEPEAALEEIFLPAAGAASWREVVRPFQAILYAAAESDIEQLRTVHTACREEATMLLPAVCVGQMGVAGPLVQPGAAGCWESAWRRLHRFALDKNTEPRSAAPAAGALLANVIVLELLRTVTGSLVESQLTNRIFVLDLETLEGDAHDFIPHPHVTGCAAAQRVPDFDLRLKQGLSGSNSGDDLLAYFNGLTSAVCGIFHTWEEGALQQLPLSQCRVQAADPLSEGPAELLPDIVCADLTHVEARREAGLAGIEAYVSRLEGQHPWDGVGAGDTFAEGVCRGLQSCLSAELGKRLVDRNPSIRLVDLTLIEDDRCRYYWQALNTLQGTPTIGLGEDVCGFPVVWAGTGGCWHAGIGLNTTMALRKALVQALQQLQNQAASLTAQRFRIHPTIREEQTPPLVAIPSVDKTTPAGLLQSALPVLARNGRRLFVYDLAVEPFRNGAPINVLGMLLREEAVR